MSMDICQDVDQFLEERSTNSGMYSHQNNIHWKPLKKTLLRSGPDHKFPSAVSFAVCGPIMRTVVFPELC